jgi:lipopolysaccharide export LptBFGC system permease protein LptF
MNGAQLTLLGGIISFVGVALSLWGAYKSSQSDEIWQRKMDDKTTILLESNTDRSKADQKIIDIREENLKAEMRRNFSKVNVDQILENSGNIENASNKLKHAKQEKKDNNHAELIKIAKPIFSAFEEYVVNFTQKLEDKGLVKKKINQFSDSYANLGKPNHGGTFFSVTTTNDKRYSTNWQNRQVQKSNIVIIMIQIHGTEPITIDIETGCTITFIDKNKFNLSPKQMNDKKNLKLFVKAMSRVLNESFTLQLGQ